MKFILVLIALASATCVTLVFVHPDAAPKPLPATQPAPGPQAPTAAEASAVKPAPAPAAAAAAAVPAPRPRPAPAAPVAATSKPSPKPPVAQPAAAVPAAPRPAVTIQPPHGLEGVAFGTPADQIAVRFPPAWRRQTSDELTLVYYPSGQGDQVRFHFNRQGLSKLELLLKPPQGQNLNQFYQAVRQRYAAAYASLPGSSSDSWHDGHTVLHVSLAPTGVSVLFYPR